MVITPGVERSNIGGVRAVDGVMLRLAIIGGAVLGLCGCGEEVDGPEGNPPPSQTGACETLETPRVVGSAEIVNPLNSAELAVIGDVAYKIAAFEPVVERFDLSAPTAIEAMPSVPFPEGANVHDLIVYGDHLLLIGGELLVVEPVDDELREVSRLDLEGDHSGSGVMIDDLLIFEGNVPAAVELHDLSQPVYVEIEGLADLDRGVFPLWAAGSTALGSYGVEGMVALGRNDAGGAAVLREYDAEELVRYAVADEEAGLVYAVTKRNGGLDVFSLVVLAEEGDDTYVELGRATAADWAIGVQRYGDQLAVFHEDLIQVYDVTDPAQPRGLESIEYREGSFFGGARLSLAGGYAVVMSETTLDMVSLCDLGDRPGV